MIKLDNGFEIAADERAYMLRQNIGRVDKKGNTVYRTLGYYVSVSDALKAYSNILRRQAISDQDLTLKEAITEFKKIADRIDELTNI